MRAYFDTSVIVALTLREDRSSLLLDWMTRHAPVAHFSDFGWGEYLSAIGLKVRRGELADAQAWLIIGQIAEPLRSWIHIRTASRHLDRAAEIIRDFSLGLRFPDAIHIAIALGQRCTLVSADRKQIAVARQFGCEAVDPYEVES